MVRHAAMALTSFFLFSLFLTSGPQADARAEPASEPIRFYDGGWENLQIHNAMAGFILEHGYGYPVEIVETDMFGMHEGLPTGEIDVNMEMWRVLMRQFVEEQTNAGKIRDLGAVYEAGTQGFYVPTYVIEGDPERGIEPRAPDLRSVEDLARYKHLFRDPADPEKGIWTNCIMGWGCREINLIKMNTYGLSQHYNSFEPDKPEGIDQRIVEAYESGEPVLSYWYGPNWLVGAYDLTRLEEPSYSEKCWAEVEKALAEFSPDARAATACAYETVSIHKFVNTGLAKRAPDAVEFLEKMFVGTDRVNELAAYMKLHEATADETAIHFLRAYPEQWRKWVPEEVYPRVQQALDKLGPATKPTQRAAG